MAGCWVVAPACSAVLRHTTRWSNTKWALHPSTTPRRSYTHLSGTLSTARTPERTRGTRRRLFTADRSQPLGRAFTAAVDSNIHGRCFTACSRPSTPRPAGRSRLLHSPSQTPVHGYFTAASHTALTHHRTFTHRTDPRAPYVRYTAGYIRYTAGYVRYTPAMSVTSLASSATSILCAARRPHYVALITFFCAGRRRRRATPT
mmetsp:Transcript_24271/g.78316  ORF Transcript_24271/g.78316 Transcript_24271/m.78316 type:complete len:203 (+) Transcript_24271:480-1088(+)